MCTETEKVKSLAQYLECLRNIHTNNCTATPYREANAHLIAANMKLQDAIIQLERAFNLLIY